MDADLEELMPNTVVWRHQGTISGRGVPTWGNPVDIRCLIVDELTEVLNANGQRQDASGTIYCNGVFAVKPEDEIKNGERVYDIVKVAQYNDEAGAYATVIFVG